MSGYPTYQDLRNKTSSCIVSKGSAGCDKEARILVCLDSLRPYVFVLLRTGGNRIQPISVSHLAILDVHHQNWRAACAGSCRAYRADQRS